MQVQNTLIQSLQKARSKTLTQQLRAAELSCSKIGQQQRLPLITPTEYLQNRHKLGNKRPIFRHIYLGRLSTRQKQTPEQTAEEEEDEDYEYVSEGDNDSGVESI